MAGITISDELIMRVREFYTMAYQEISSNKRKQVMDDNGYTDYAIPSYILSVTAVEVFVNEIFIALGQDFLKGSSWDRLSQDEIDKLSKKLSQDEIAKLSQDEIQKCREKNRLRDKLLQFPKLAFDQEVFNKGSPPFQDMNFLIKVRNSFVHYKMELEPEEKVVFDDLVRKGVAIKSPDNPNRFWANDLCTFEGIRWAHNTALKIIKDIIDTAVKTNRHQILITMGTQTGNFFRQIPDPHKDRELWLAWLKFHCNWEKVKKPKAG